MDRARLVNRTVFLLSVVLTGALAGAFVWAVLLAMDLGIGLVWDSLSSFFGVLFPVGMCIVGGAVIGLSAKRLGPYPEDMGTVMSVVRAEGSYGRGKVGRITVSALLPLVFGGSVGPEAGLVGVIAGLCSWAADRMRRFGADFRELSEAGVTAAISALFTAPLYGFAAGVTGRPAGGSEAPRMSRWARAATCALAIVGALGTLLLLTHFVGGGMALPHYEWESVGAEELLWIVPLIAVGAAGGWLYRVADAGFRGLSGRFAGREVLMPVVAGAVLGVCGVVLPLTMFSGETQIGEVDSMWVAMGAPLLLATGVVKILVTAMCVNMGWRGGHFFPVIFAGISIGYGMSLLSGADPVFCLCVVTAALVGGVMRRPVMAVLLLFLCFPLPAAVPMLVAAFLGSKVPLPGWAREEAAGEAPRVSS